MFFAVHPKYPKTALTVHEPCLYIPEEIATAQGGKIPREKKDKIAKVRDRKCACRQVQDNKSPRYTEASRGDQKSI